MKKIIRLLIKLCIYSVLGLAFLFVIDGKKTINDITQMNKIQIYDKNNKLIYASSNLHEGNYLSLNNMSSNIIKIFIASEDKRFYSHNGFDSYRILKSILTSSSSGASTITQQYIKNLYFNNERSYIRKLKELYLSIRLEMDYSKDEILEGYLNTIYFGNDQYGIYDAAIYYFNKHPYNLSIAQICVLANIIKNPTMYCPISNYSNALLKRNSLLRSLHNSKIINDEDFSCAINEDLVINKGNPKQYDDSILYFKDIVLHELSKLNIKKDYNQTIKIYTKYDSSLNKNVSTTFTNLNNENASFICVDSEGYYMSTIGGVDYSKSSFNIGLKGKRQIASTVKPLLYYDAILRGYKDKKFVSNNTKFIINGDTYRFKNYGSIYENRAITMAEALATSDNMYALKMHLFLKMKGINRTLEKFKIKDNESISQALGTTAMSLNTLLKIYYSFANEGRTTIFRAIDEVIINKKTIYKSHPDISKLLDENACNILKEKMHAMFVPNYNLKASPTGLRISNKLKKKTYGKSGLDDFNSYMIGFTEDYLMGAWVGYTDNIELTNINSKALPKVMILEGINSLY